MIFQSRTVYTICILHMVTLSTSSSLWSCGRSLLSASVKVYYTSAHHLSCPVDHFLTPFASVISWPHLQLTTHLDLHNQFISKYFYPHNDTFTAQHHNIFLLNFLSPSKWQQGRVNRQWQWHIGFNAHTQHSNRKWCGHSDKPEDSLLTAKGGKTQKYIHSTVQLSSPGSAGKRNVFIIYSYLF